MQFLNYLIKSVISFLFISGIIYILDTKLNLLTILNSATLKNIESSLVSKNIDYANNTDSVVLLLDNIIFEREFDSQTPLNKLKLKSLIEVISKHEPKSIVFDLDISPDYDFQNKNKNYSKNHLYDYLKSIANEVNIILPFAFMSSTNENKVLKASWVKEMCNNNIQFAIPYVSSEIGATIQYHKYDNHLAFYSYKILHNDNISQSICQQITKIKKINFTQIENSENVKYEFSNQQPINYSKINSNTILLSNLTDLNKYDLRDKTIFLGGGYGFGDKFITPYGEKFGVQVLDAIFYSLSHDISHASVDIATSMDILIGLLFGFFISFTVGYRIKVKTNNGLVLNNIFLLCILISFIWISTIISTYLFHNLYIWLNPVPIIVGMFIDMIMGMEKNKILSKNYKDSLLQLGSRYLFVAVGVISFL